MNARVPLTQQVGRGKSLTYDFPSDYTVRVVRESESDKNNLVSHNKRIEVSVQETIRVVYFICVRFVVRSVQGRYVRGSQGLSLVQTGRERAYGEEGINKRHSTLYVASRTQILMVGTICLCFQMERQITQGTERIGSRLHLISQIAYVR